MKLYINDELYEFTENDLNRMYESEGNECVAYKFEDIILKVYKKFCRKVRLDEQTIDTFSHIDTNRVRLPRGKIYDENHAFAGYYDMYIKWNPLLLINDMKISKFIDELKIIDEDLNILSENFIKIDDIIRDNFNYNNGIYLVDPGSYYIDLSSDKNDIFIENRKMINEFIIEDILFYVGLTSKKKKRLQEYFDGVDYIENAITSDFLPNETVKSYVKRICA